jgi:ribose-phosphate pyrophosphokinase
LPAAVISALKDAGASRVTAVTPYLCYARKDRRTKVQDPVTIRYVAALFDAAGADGIVTLEVHNEAAFERFPLPVRRPECGPAPDR